MTLRVTMPVRLVGAHRRMGPSAPSDVRQSGVRIPVSVSPDEMTSADPPDSVDYPRATPPESGASLKE